MESKEKIDYPLIEFNRKLINLRKIFYKAKKDSHIPIMGYIDNLCTDLIIFLAKKENLEYVQKDEYVEGYYHISLHYLLKEKYPNFLPKECNEYILNQHENFTVCANAPSEEINDYNLEGICLYNVYGFCYFLFWFKDYYFQKCNKNANFDYINSILIFFKNLEIPFEDNDLNIYNNIQRNEDLKDIEDLTLDNFELFKPKFSEKQPTSQKSESTKNNDEITTTEDTLKELGKLNDKIELFYKDFKQSKDLILENQQTQITQNERIEDKVDEIIWKINSVFDELSSYQSILENQIQNVKSEEFIDDLMRPFVDEYTSKLVNITKQEHNNINYEQEKRKLISSLGNESWNKLSDKSKTFLITSKFIFNYLIMLEDIIDYSSICLLVTKTLEVELTERFFKNFVKYLKAEYGKDYSQYHTSLLGWNKNDKKHYVLKPKNCDLGRITFILGFNKDKSLNEEQHKNNMIKLVEYSKNNLFNNLTNDEIEEKLYYYGSLVNEIRIRYRNPAAHTNKLKRIDAEECFNLIIDVEKVLKKMLDSFNY